MYHIIDDTIINKRRFLVIANHINYENKRIEISPLVGKKRLLIKENVLSDIAVSNKYIVAKIINHVILVEGKEFKPKLESNNDKGVFENENTIR